MRQKMYSIFDSVAEIFNKPFLSHNDRDATRSFIQGINDQAFQNKGDYYLYLIGEFNDHTGEITPCIPEKVYSGFEASKREVEQS